MVAKHGVIMLSATFFRSRFDMLFFMLKMLRTGLPETKVKASGGTCAALTVYL